jgi:hypothetical protein
MTLTSAGPARADLTVDHGWTAECFEHWLADCLGRLPLS